MSVGVSRWRNIPLWTVSVGMMVVLMVNWGLRLIYALDVGPFSDEYITMLAARSVLQTGLPVLPSGRFYNHGILFVYLEALFLGVIGFSVDIARLVSAFVGVLVAAVTYKIGRSWFSPRAGLLAAWLLTWSPVDILWQGRARMYPLLQLAFLVGVALVYEGSVRRESCLCRCGGIVALGGAVLAHLLAIPYIATMVVSLIVVRLWVRWRGEGDRLPIARLWPDLLVGLVTTGVVVLVRLVRGRGAGGRVVTDPSILLDGEYLVGRALAWMRLFIAWPNLLWTVLVIVGVIALVFRLWRRAGRQDDPPWVYLLLIWLGSVVGLGVFSVWYADNYVVGLMPIFHLVAARELDGLGWTIEKAANRRGVAWGAAAIAAVMVLILAWPGAISTVTDSTLVLEQALDYVRQHWRDGDRVVTFAPHASLLVLGQADFYGQEKGYPFRETEVGRVDMWTGAPVLDSVEKLEKVLTVGRRVWLIVHRENWHRHYSEAYRRLVETRMKLVFDGADVLVYLSES